MSTIVKLDDHVALQKDSMGVAHLLHLVLTLPAALRWLRHIIIIVPLLIYNLIYHKQWHMFLGVLNLQELNIIVFLFNRM